MPRKRPTSFNPQTFLATVGKGKTTLRCRKNQVLFSQGDTADAVFYIQEGKVKLTVISRQGKEAVVAIQEQGVFSARPAWPGDRCTWEPRRPWPRPRSCASRKPR
jgi:CRP/FNR family transcriptional regulator, cyclic AMP receptor protein